MLVLIFLLLRLSTSGVHSGYAVFYFNISTFAKMFIVFRNETPTLSDFIFSGIPYKLKLLVRKFFTSFVSEVLQIFTVGQLLNLSTAIRNCTSLCKFLSCIFPVKSMSIFGRVRFFLTVKLRQVVTVLRVVFTACVDGWFLACSSFGLN